MTRDLRMNVDGDASGARRALDTAGRALDDVARQTRQLERSFVAASGAAVVVAKRIDNVGDQARTSAAEAKLLARALDDVGDQARQAGRAMGGINGGLSGKGLLTGFAGEATQVAAKAGTEAASTFASAIEGGLMTAFKSLPPEAQAAVGGGVAAAISVGAPIIASALSGALLLGVGSAGLAGGIALAIRNDQVKRAFAGLGEILMANLSEAARPFQSELVESANIFGAAFRNSLPDIKGTFAVLSEAVRPLAGGLAGLVRNILPGLRRAAEASVPVFRELARQAPEIGAALSEFFDDVAAAGPGAVATFRELLNLTKGLVVASGSWLEQIGYVAQGAAIVNDIMIPIGKQSSVLSGPLTSSLEDVGAAAEGTSRSVRMLQIDLDKLFGREMDAREAAIAYEQALDDLAEGFKRGAGALDINTQKGRDNLRYIDDAINGARNKLKADLDAAAGSQAAIDAANRAYQSEIDRIRDVLRHMGLQESEIDKLIGKANAIPKSITIDIGLVGAQAAAGMLNSLSGAISRALGSGLSVSASKSLQKRASGGPVVAGEAYIVGDGGKPEVFVPNSSGRILPDTSALARHASGVSAASRGAAPALMYKGGPSGGLEALFLSWLMKKVQNGDLGLATS